METKKIIFEVCENHEFIEQSFECPENPDSLEIAGVVDEQIMKFEELCKKAGISAIFQSPKHGRLTYHGWNGARFTYKNKIFGTFEELTSKAIEILDRY
jgi:hypothetical protein